MFLFWIFQFCMQQSETFFKPVSKLYRKCTGSWNMKSDIVKRNQIIIPNYKRVGYDKVIRNMKYSFISMPVVPQFQGVVDLITTGSFPRSRRK